MLTRERLTELREKAVRSYLEAKPLSGYELAELARELIQHRDERPKLQGEIERLTHELREATETRPRLARADQRSTEHDRQINKRLDSVVNTFAELRRMFDMAETRTINLLDDIAALKLPDGEKQDGAAFPTGAGTTVEDAVAVAEAEAWTAALTQEPAETDPLKPQRGDRVLLEGARTLGGRLLEPGWFDCIGQDADDSFQVKAGGGRYPWIDNTNPGLKEVRRGAARLDE